ncbi:MAG: class I SAM-dependent methyltransferase [Actinobacteria bacterium]|nr:class I SAM-dependent methyltransferase [Actinomycetota bacterium]
MRSSTCGAPRSVVDVGCGTGLVLEKLAARGVEVRGVEGSRAAIARSPVADRIVRANLERGVPQLGTVDLCLCIEVAEHLRPRSAERLVEGLTRLSRVVVFTAAQPGQPGTPHLNCRPKSYWRSLFAHHGFSPSPQEAALAAAISGVAEPQYIHSNLMVLERAG